MPLLRSTTPRVLLLTLSFALFFSVVGATSPRAASTELLLAPIGELGLDEFGYSVSTAGDVNGDGFSDFIVGAHQNSAGGAFAGRAYVYFGGPLADTTADLTFAGVAGENLGTSVGTAGDINGDGFDDLIVGADGNDVGGVDAGRAYVYFGGPGADAVADLTLTGEAAGDRFGVSVATAGDVNGDGYDDVIVGAYLNDAGGASAGRSYVFYGGASPNATADLIFTGETSTIQLGNSVGTAGDVNGDGFSDLIVGVSAHGAEGINSGRAYLYYGGPGADSVVDLAFTSEGSGDYFGISVGTAGDVNGDGFADLIVGAYRNDVGGADAGRAYVYFGGPGVDAVADLTFTGEAVNDWFGWSVGTAGDVNRDGYDDLIVGAEGHDGGATSSGRAYIYFGGPGADSSADLIVTGGAAYDNFGFSVGAAGDVNGDGFDEFIVGAIGDDSGGTDAGRAYVYSLDVYKVDSPNGGEQWVAGQPTVVKWRGFQPADLDLSFDGGASWLTLAVGVGGDAQNEYSLLAPGITTEFALVRLTQTGQVPSLSNSITSAAPFRIVAPHEPPPAAHRLGLAPAGEAGGDQFGISAGAAGDVNGDGFDDFIVGGVNNDAGASNAGRAYVYYGGPLGDTSADLTFTGAAAYDYFGRVVGTAGDVNGDGFDDLIVGADRNDAGGTDSGRAYVYYGGPGADPTPDLILTGEATFDYFGIAVGTAGDVNGDGFDDVVVGASRNDVGGTDAGRAYVYYGGVIANTTPDLILTGEASGDRFAYSVSTAGDVNGDGYDDLIIGAWANAVAGIQGGRAYVYYGGPSADTVADLVFSGETENNNFGYSVGTAGDVNGDGFDDLIVGAYANDTVALNAGRAYVYFGGPGADDTADLVFSGEAEGDFFGVTVGTAGDVNGDGFDDLIVGAAVNDAGAANAGRVYVYYGGPGVDAIADFVITGEVPNGHFGISVGTAGDVNGDGFDDFLCGAYNDKDGGITTGRAYVYDCNRYHMTSPTGGDTWNVGAVETVSWLGAEPADLWLSVDGGDSYSLLDDEVGGSSSNTVALTVPHQPTRFAKIKVTPHDSAVSGKAKTDSLFTIEASVALLNLLATPIDGGGVLLSWETDPGPEDLMGYKVERAAGNNERWTVLSAMTRETSYLDNTGSETNRYRLSAINGLGEELLLGETAFTPKAALSAWPVPYRGGDMQVSFLTAGGLGGVPESARVALFDINGRLVRTLADGSYEAGRQTATWDGTNQNGVAVANGVYFLRVTSVGTNTQMKVVISR